jgi:hypothetical protein
MERYDHDALLNTTGAAIALCTAQFFAESAGEAAEGEVFAAECASVLRAWFVTPATMMSSAAGQWTLLPLFFMLGRCKLEFQDATVTYSSGDKQGRWVRHRLDTASRW